jgi:GDPmannose 4,6-dehydratase
MKTAIVTGCPGQDATLLVDFLLKKDYTVIGTYRYSSTPFDVRFKNYPTNNIHFSAVCCDIVDPSSCLELVNGYQPDEIYNLAAMSHVGESFKQPLTIFDINTKAVVNWLEVIKKVSPHTRLCQASTSEMWGSNFSTDNDNVSYQDESTPFEGNSPYAVSKIAAHNMVKLYRNSYDLFVCSSMCHNHESEFRGEQFVTRKITKWVGEFSRWCYEDAVDLDAIEHNENYLIYKDNKFPKLRLGNINTVRDWSYAGDFIRAMWMMLQQDYPDDYVLASGKGHTVKDFLHRALSLVGVPDGDYTHYYVIDPKFYRPCEVEFLQGRAKKAKTKLGWYPKVSFDQLVKMMVDYDRIAR